jgi:thiol-disulfide isomerase/thioredoxin
MTESRLRSLLRIARYTAIIGIFVVAGFFAGRFFWSPTDAPPTTARSVETVPMPDVLPDIQLADLDGNVHSFSEWSEGPLLINFWATWCAPCLREMPLLETVWQTRGESGLTILGVAIDRNEAITPYVEKTGVTYPILAGQSDAMKAAEAFGPDFAGLPYSVFVATDGRVIGTYSGELHPEYLNRVLDLLDAVSGGRVSIAEARAQLAD